MPGRASVNGRAGVPLGRVAQLLSSRSSTGNILSTCNTSGMQWGHTRSGKRSNNEQCHGSKNGWAPLQKFLHPRAAIVTPYECTTRARGIQRHREARVGEMRARVWGRGCVKGGIEEARGFGSGGQRRSIAEFRHACHAERAPMGRTRGK